MQAEFGSIRVGTLVDIQRSNGKIHSARVTGLNVGTRVVTVEWFEGGDTKGKEVDLESILRLNGNLTPSNSSLPISKESTASVRRSVSTVRPTQLTKPAPRNKSCVAPVSESCVEARRRRNSARETNGLSKAGDGSMVNGSRTSLDRNKTCVRPPSLLSLDPMEPLLKTGRRKSAVVYEMEKIQEAREHRKGQKAILEEQRKRDPGNPNWGFLQMILDYKEELDMKPLVDGDPVSDNRITVCIRKRPMNSKEQSKKEVDVVTVATKDQVTIHEPKTKVDLTKYLENQQFRFDAVFDESASNELVYKYTAKSLVGSIFEGGMATCFAYGQTGSGKTHTMGGEFNGKSQDCNKGIYALATKDVFRLNSTKYKDANLVVSCSYFEIYSGKVFDLLSGKCKLKVMEDGKQQVVVVGLMETVVDSVEQVLGLIEKGNSIRTSGKTSANSNSSRSHAVFQILLRSGQTRKKPLVGKFSLIDLAGNERGSDTNSADRKTRMEGAEINKSLLALKECIRALGRKGTHLPFRASKLTQVLKDSFVGVEARTCMIAMIGPSISSCEHTLNTLRYADRVKELAVGSTEDEAGDTMEECDDNSNQSGLADLRNLNVGECSQDWFGFQESVAHLQALEEELVETHRNVLEDMKMWSKQDSTLLELTNQVDYDQDAYALILEEMLDEKLGALDHLAAKAREFRSCLAAEEAASNKRRK